MKYIFYFFIFLSLYLFTGCGKPYPPKDTYNLEECQEELMNSMDFNETGSVDKIVVIKAKRTMYLYEKGKVVGKIPVSLGKNPVGQKEEQGDGKTPEGEFFIHRKLCSPKYYRSLCISYPRPEDRVRAKKHGVNPGGDVTIHAQPKWNADGHGDAYTLSNNWTHGCVAVTNSSMKRLWYAVHEGVMVTIK